MWCVSEVKLHENMLSQRHHHKFKLINLLDLFNIERVVRYVMLTFSSLTRSQVPFFFSKFPFLFFVYR